MMTNLPPPQSDAVEASFREKEKRANEAYQATKLIFDHLQSLYMQLLIKRLALHAYKTHPPSAERVQEAMRQYLELKNRWLMARMEWIQSVEVFRKANQCFKNWKPPKCTDHERDK